MVIQRKFFNILQLYLKHGIFKEFHRVYKPIETWFNICNVCTPVLCNCLKCCFSSNYFLYNDFGVSEYKSLIITKISEFNSIGKSTTVVPKEKSEY